MKNLQLELYFAITSIAENASSNNESQKAQ